MVVQKQCKCFLILSEIVKYCFNWFILCLLAGLRNEKRGSLINPGKRGYCNTCMTVWRYEKHQSSTALHTFYSNKTWNACFPNHSDHILFFVAKMHMHFSLSGVWWSFWDAVIVYWRSARNGTILHTAESWSDCALGRTRRRGRYSRCWKEATESQTGRPDAVMDPFIKQNIKMKRFLSLYKCIHFHPFKWGVIMSYFIYVKLDIPWNKMITLVFTYRLCCFLIMF